MGCRSSFCIQCILCLPAPRLCLQEAAQKPGPGQGWSTAGSGGLHKWVKPSRLVSGGVRAACCPLSSSLFHSCPCSASGEAEQATEELSSGPGGGCRGARAAPAPAENEGARHAHGGPSLTHCPAAPLSSHLLFSTSSSASAHVVPVTHCPPNGSSMIPCPSPHKQPHLSLTPDESLGRRLCLRLWLGSLKAMHTCLLVNT